METKKLKIQNNLRNDEYFTPKYALNPLLTFLKKEWVVWECAYGGGNLAKHLEELGFKVKGAKSINFLDCDCPLACDIIITNPPYSKKEEFLKKAYGLGKPFAFLMPLTTLEGKRRGELFKKYGIQIIIPNRRINFITPSGQGGGAWFQTAWFCYGLNLPKDIMFIELNI